MGLQSYHFSPKTGKKERCVGASRCKYHKRQSEHTYKLDGSPVTPEQALTYEQTRNVLEDFYNNSDEASLQLEENYHINEDGEFKRIEGLPLTSGKTIIDINYPNIYLDVKPGGETYIKYEEYNHIFRTPTAYHPQEIENIFHPNGELTESGLRHLAKTLQTNQPNNEEVHQIKIHQQLNRGKPKMLITQKLEVSPNHGDTETEAKQEGFDFFINTSVNLEEHVYLSAKRAESSETILQIADHLIPKDYDLPQEHTETLKNSYPSWYNYTMEPSRLYDLLQTKQFGLNKNYASIVAVRYGVEAGFYQNEDELIEALGDDL